MCALFPSLSTQNVILRERSGEEPHWRREGVATIYNCASLFLKKEKKTVPVLHAFE